MTDGHDQATPAKSLRALVLDPDPASLRALTRSLEARCFSVASANDGARGLDLLLEELLGLDALVMDAALPHRDALAFAELIRRAGGERELALVVVARNGTAELRAALLELGVDAVVDSREGPGAAADAAISAVAARGARPVEPDEPDEAPRPAAREPELDLETTARFALPLAPGWTLAAA
ncbi:MAG TPA: response regulator [Anaeromyxobacter sp.]